jgi:hypothetical protein
VASLLLVGVASGGVAAEPSGAPAPRDPAPTQRVEVGDDDEFIIVADKFARWDNTRWYSEMQIGFPIPYPLYARVNKEFRATALQLRASFLCEKTFRRGKKGFEVRCDIEGAGLQAVPFETKAPGAADVLAELDQALTDSAMVLFVSDDGRVNDLTLEGFSANNNRELTIRESARQLMLRLMAGFHMKLPRQETTVQGQWVEHNPALLLLPVINQVEGMAFAPEGSSTSNLQFETFTSIGSSFVVHQIDRYKGHLVVQSEGRGMVTDGGFQEDDGGNQYAVKLTGVSLYSPDTGIMTERVYAITGETTASSRLADGWAGSMYFHSGRVRMLGEKDVVDVGPTQVVRPPGAAAGGAWGALPAWSPME